ncbi:MAG: transcription termination/antitermination protein NusA [Lentisphaerae bacterium]|nr:transcription termination/antitermination protein NusA [Lentisphaerota bacterium]MCP4101923.1 transcription termination/antitermination protein NusA [Lentisphaerota bacterium]
MNNELLTILEYIEQERGIKREVLVKAVESALLSASRKSIHPASSLKVEVDPNTGEIRAWAKLEVVDTLPSNDQLLLERAQEKISDVKIGDVIDWEVTPKNFGRIAAQTAKQAIMQQLRKAEKEIVRDEFADRIGQIINGTVRRFESGNIIIDFQKAEGVLNSKEKIYGEQYMPGDRINAVLLKVDISGGGPSLVVSRTHPNFVRRLFEREVSEIHDGIVEIMGIAREAGSRTKIAVKSNDPRIDPVGACVGLRGIRVKNITTELSGERIDIVPYDEDLAKYTTNALQPAKVQSVKVINKGGRDELNVYVTPEQSRLAFGKKAQNVRLSSKLIMHNINIIVNEPVHEDTLEDKIRKASHGLAEALGVKEDTAMKLISSGYVSIEGIKTAGADEINSIEDIDPEEVENIFKAINEGE